MSMKNHPNAAIYLVKGGGGMKRSFHFMQQLDLSDEVLPRQPLVEICADRRVLIENHGGVTEYGSEKIAVRVRFGTVVIYGTGLKLCKMAPQQLVITGRIGSVELSRG